MPGEPNPYGDQAVQGQGAAADLAGAEARGSAAEAAGVVSPRFRIDWLVSHWYHIGITN